MNKNEHYRVNRSLRKEDFPPRFLNLPSLIDQTSLQETN